MRLTAEAALELARWQAHVRLKRSLPKPPDNSPADSKPTPRQFEVARDIARAVHRAQRNSPRPAKCLPECLAAQAMLARREIVSYLHIGTRRAGSPPNDPFHAWLTCGPYLLAGLCDPSDYAELVPLS